LGKICGKIIVRGSYEPEIIPEVGELDELETFVNSKKAARPRAAERRKGMLAKTTKSRSGQR
jgi:hypothetical protein